MPAADELLVRYRLHKQSLLEEPLEPHAPPPYETAIKPERKLIEVVGEKGMTNRPLMCLQPPAFQENGDPMDARHDLMSRIPLAAIFLGRC
jgi:hypothetical protein